MNAIKYLKDFKPCPICGKADRLFLTTSKNFYALQSENGSACVCVSCDRCNLDLYDHSHQCKEYPTRIKKLCTKWNRRLDETD